MLYRRYDITRGAIALFLPHAVFTTERSFLNVPPSILEIARDRCNIHSSGQQPEDIHAERAAKHGSFTYTYDIDQKLLETLLAELELMRKELESNDTTEISDRNFLRFGFVKKP